MNSRPVKVPGRVYVKAKELQDSWLKEHGFKLPLWKSVVMVDKPSLPSAKTKPFRGFRL